MKRGLVKFFCSLFAAVMILPLFSVPASSARPFVDSTAAMVFNLEQEKILYEKNAEARLTPGPFTKLMTALLAFEYRKEKGNIAVTVTEEMLSSAGGTVMGLKVGEVISFDSLLTGLVVANANDAALVLASQVGGSVSAFVERMNAKAKELGMTQSYYANPTGIDSALMYTTMRDILTLCCKIYRVNDYVVLSEMATAVIPSTNVSGERNLTNKNALIPYSYVTDYYMKGVRGLISGYTGGAGHCVATVREKNGCTNLVILSGGRDRSEGAVGTDISSYRDARALLEWAEEDFSLYPLLNRGEVICERKVLLSGQVDHILLVAGESLTKLLPTDPQWQQQLRYEVKETKDQFTAPILQGEIYGKVEIFYRGESMGEVPLVAQNSVNRSSWLMLWDGLQRFFSRGPARLVLILVLAAAVLYVLGLAITVWVHYIRLNRERKEALAELNRQENRRLRQVKHEEREANRARLRRAGTFLRAGYRVLSGEAEVMDVSPKKEKEKKELPRRAVAKVPEQYRKKKDPVSSSEKQGKTEEKTRLSSQKDERRS